jgi:chaperone BCS1
MKVPYKLSTAQQARAVFLRFFPESGSTSDPVFSPPASESRADVTLVSSDPILPVDVKPLQKHINELADAFAAAIPPERLSTAQIQGYLQGHKNAPAAAVAGISSWVKDVMDERQARDEREAEHRMRCGKASEPDLEAK